MKRLEMAYQIRSAVTNKDETALTALIKSGGVDLNQRLNGSTPLGLAVYFGYLRGVELLLEAGANPNIRMTILDIQCEYQYTGAEPPLTYLVRKPLTQSMEIAKLLLSHGANPSAEDTLSFTPLFYAATRNDLQFTKLLFQYGADISKVMDSLSDVFDFRGYPMTVLHIAFDSGKEELAQYLLQHAMHHGCLHDVQDGEGNQECSSPLKKVWLLMKIA